MSDLSQRILLFTAFPLLAGLYGIRGLSDNPITPSKLESNITKVLKINIDTLNEWYSAFIPLGFAYLRLNALVSGYLLPHILASSDYLETVSKITDGALWTCGLTGFWALGMWIRRRQERREMTKKPFFGLPEVSIGLLSVILLPLICYPGTGLL